MLFVLYFLIFKSANTQENTLTEKINNCQGNYTCITNLGIEYQNDSICEALGSYSYESVRGCQLNVLIAEGNISNCGKSYYYYSCEQAILNKTKSITTCSSVADAYVDIRDVCYIIIAPSISADTCEKISNALPKDICYQEYAFFTKNISICNKVNDPYEKSSCLNLSK